MIALLPGIAATDAAVALREAARAAGDVVGAAGASSDYFRAYLRWATEQLRMIRSKVRPEDLDLLITSRQDWAIQGITVGGYGDHLGEFIKLELAERIDQLKASADELEAEQRRWSIPSMEATFPDALTPVVVDTVFLMHHHAELATFDWSKALGTRPDRSLGIAVPIAVVRELDKLKRSNAQMVIDGQKIATRSLARQALRVLAGHLGGADNTLLREAGWDEGPVARLHLLLMNDSLGHRPLDVPDYEIIDRATTLLPFAKEVYLVTYDSAMAFTARQTPLKVVQLTEADDT